MHLPKECSPGFPIGSLTKWLRGKGSTIEESVGSDKFIGVGKNCYIGVNSTLASHLVRGIFGNISYFEVKLKDNVTLAAMNQIGPCI